jgi:hypothetical protein
VTTGKGLRDRQRRRMFKAQDGRCWLCAGIMLIFSAEDADWTHPAAATREHVVPAAHGGSRAVANTTLTHRICNQVRGDILDEHEARRHVLEQIGGQALTYMRTERARADVLLAMIRQHQRNLRAAQRAIQRAAAGLPESNTGGRVLPEFPETSPAPSS